MLQHGAGLLVLGGWVCAAPPQCHIVLWLVPRCSMPHAGDGRGQQQRWVLRVVYNGGPPSSCTPLGPCLCAGCIEGLGMISLHAVVTSGHTNTCARHQGPLPVPGSLLLAGSPLCSLTVAPHAAGQLHT